MNETVRSEDVLSVREQRERRETAAPDQPLYKNRAKVYPKKIDGIWRRVKWATLIVLLGIYYLVPWIRWDRGPNAPDQAVLIDMEARRAYFFFIEIWPQEIYYLTAVLFMGAVGIFLATSLLGRVWCGYTCPQTVWTDLFMWVERLVEGDRSQRMRLDKAGLSLSKAWKKTAKHSIWMLIAMATGGAWIMYFQDAPTLVVDFFSGRSSKGTYFFFGLFTATTYLLAGWAREQVCTYMCPWPRFQAAMMDEDSFIVTYQRWRGEPRGKHKAGESWEGRGDCIDCKLCVAVCPTGIDIRDGVQLECINCALCIDACNSIMDKVGRPRELITYDTERNQARLAQGKERVFRWVRPRTIFYAALMVLAAAAVVYSLATRATVDVNVLHDRNPVFVTLSDGAVRNGYTVKILNMKREAQDYELLVRGLSEAALSVVGRDETVEGPVKLGAEPDSVATYKIYISVPPDALTSEASEVTFKLTNTETGETALKESVFRGPEK